MNKESFKRRLNSVKNFFKAATLKIRYRSVYIGKKINKKTKKGLHKVGSFIIGIFVSLGRLIKKSILATIEKIMANKRKAALGAACFAAMIFCGVSLFNMFTAYEYSYNGEVLGVVDEPSSVYDGIEIAERTLTEEIGAKVVIDKEEDIEVQRIINNSEVGSEADVVNALTSIEEIEVVTYPITIATEGGIKEIHIDTKANAYDVLAALKSKFLGKYELDDYLEITFAQDVQVVESKANLDDILTTQEALDYILTGGIEEEIHVVKKGESLASISNKYDVPIKDIKKWNPKIGKSNLVFINQEIQLKEQIALIDVITKRNDTFTENYGPEIEYVDTDKLYEGMEKVIKEGKSGNRTVNADIIEKNGKQVGRDDHSYTVHKEQLISKVYRGTKKRPEKIGKGYYAYPMSGKFTSPFGRRWGRMHNGIDICGPTGTNVYAADAGVVTAAGPTSNGYGIAVKINHGNGRSTYYAHNSKVLVKVGETVYRGQHIAESGNTGASTGPHLHFETHFNGVPKNPMSYL